MEHISITSERSAVVWWLKYLAPKREFQVRHSARLQFYKAGWSGRYIHVRHCDGPFVVLLQLKDPLESIFFCFGHFFCHIVYES